MLSGEQQHNPSLLVLGLPYPLIPNPLGLLGKDAILDCLSCELSTHSFQLVQTSCITTTALLPLTLPPGYVSHIGPPCTNQTAEAPSTSAHPCPGGGAAAVR